MYPPRQETILITGGTGFLGRALVPTLTKSFDLIFLVQKTTDISRLKILPTAKIYFIEETRLSDIFKRHQISTIIHLATQYSFNIQSITSLYQTNFFLALQLMECAIQYRIKLFVNADTFYPKYYDLYSLSKKQFIETLTFCQKYYKIANCIIFHMYGAEDNPKKFIPQIIKKMIKDEPIDFTTGGQRRDFICVEDVVDAIMTILAKQDSWTEPYLDFEIGTGESTPIRLFVEGLATQLNSKSQLNFGAIPYRENEILDSKANVNLLNKYGWQPKIDLNQGIKKLVEAYVE